MAQKAESIREPQPKSQGLLCFTMDIASAHISIISLPNASEEIIYRMSLSYSFVISDSVPGIVTLICRMWFVNLQIWEDVVFCLWERDKKSLQLLKHFSLWLKYTCVAHMY